MSTRELELVAEPLRDDDARDDRKDARAEANSMMLGGLGIGAVGMLAAAVGGAVCPVCVVAAPALLGVGAYKRWRSSKKREG